MNNAIKCVVLAALVAMAGCADKQMSRAEYMAATSRTYAKTPDQVLNASEKLFRLNDGDDYNITYEKDAMTAVRSWQAFYILAAAFGYDTWIIKTELTADGRTVVSADVKTYTGSGYGGQMKAASGPAVYDLYFRRLEHLMGLRKEWTTCDQINTEYVAGKTWGDTKALCTKANMKNTDPTTGKSEYPYENGKQ